MASSVYLVLIMVLKHDLNLLLALVVKMSVAIGHLDVAMSDHLLDILQASACQKNI